MSAPETAPYEALARMIERELELVGTGDYDALAALKSERDALIATLPGPAGNRAPCAAASGADEQARRDRDRARREALLIEFANVELVGRTARGYSPPRQESRHVEATA